MPEILLTAPDEIQLQVADDDGMIDRKEIIENDNRETSMFREINYQLVQEGTAEWEGMISVRR
jgi:hypothetical protein